MFFWPFNSICIQIQTPWPRKPKVRLSFNNHWSLLWVFKTDVLLTPNANRQIDRQTNEFFSYDPPYSRGNKELLYSLSISARSKLILFPIRYYVDCSGINRRISRGADHLPPFHKLNELIIVWIFNSDEGTCPSSKKL